MNLVFKNTPVLLLIMVFLACGPKEGAVPATSTTSPQTSEAVPAVVQINVVNSTGASTGFTTFPNYPASYLPLSVSNFDGITRVYGNLQGTLGTLGQLIFALPKGFNPLYTSVFTASAVDGTLTPQVIGITAEANGNIGFVGPNGFGASALISLEGIQFLNSHGFDMITNPKDRSMVLLAPTRPSAPKKLIFWPSGYFNNLKCLLSLRTNTVVPELLAEGWYVLTQSTSLDVAGTTMGDFGNPTTQAKALEAIQWAKTIYSISSVDIISESMGGLIGMNLYLKDTSNQFGRWYGIYPLLSIEWAWVNSNAQQKSELKAVYGISSDSDVTGVTADHDPLRLPVSYFAGKKFKIRHSESDTIVNKDANVDAVAARVGSIPASFDVVTTTGDHGDPSSINAAEIIQFFKN